MGGTGELVMINNLINYISHYTDVIISAMASQNTSVSFVYSNVCSGTDKRKHQSFASLAFVRGIHRSPVNSPHKRPVTRKMSPFDDVIIYQKCHFLQFSIPRVLDKSISMSLLMMAWVLTSPGYYQSLY